MKVVVQALGTGREGRQCGSVVVESHGSVVWSMSEDHVGWRSDSECGGTPAPKAGGPEFRSQHPSEKIAVVMILRG